MEAATTLVAGAGAVEEAGAVLEKGSLAEETGAGLVRVEAATASEEDSKQLRRHSARRSSPGHQAARSTCRRNLPKHTRHERFNWQQQK
eukprot:6196306-Pleurochrysis_carterae.AAC.2